MNRKTDWTNVPQQSKKATVRRTRLVENASVVHVGQAFIRGSTVSGCFKLAKGADIKAHKDKKRIEVECLWFGCKPKTTWMHITLLREVHFFYGYSGKVAFDIRD